jgi:hypothetical protein
MEKKITLGKAIKIKVKDSVSNSVWGVAYEKLDKLVSARIYNSIIHLQKESEVYEMYYAIWLSVKRKS